MNQFQRFFKAVQRRVYDFLLTKYGLAFLCFSVLVIIIFSLQLSETMLEYRNVQLKRLNNIINMKNASITLSIIYNANSKDRANGDEENESHSFKTNIDVVYTWVNGSDPLHVENLKKYKLNKQF